MYKKMFVFSIVLVAVCGVSVAAEVDQNGVVVGPGPVTTHTLEQLTQPLIGESGVSQIEQVERREVWFGSLPDEVTLVPVAEYESYIQEHGGSPTPLPASEEGYQSDGMIPLWGDDVLIHGPESGMASPSVAVADNGDIYAAVERDNGTTQGLWIYRSTDDGATWSLWHSNASTAADRRRPHIIINDWGVDEYLFLVYDILSTAGEYNIWSAKSTLGSASFTYQAIDSTSGTEDTRPAIDEDLYDPYYLYVTYQRISTADQGNILFSRSTDYGVTWETPYSIATSGVGEYRDPEIGYGFGGNVYVAWWLDGATGYDDGIRVVKGTGRVPDISSWTLTTSTSNSDGIDDREPSVASVSSGQNVEVLFRRLNTNWDIHELYSSNGGTNWNDRHFASGGDDNRTRWPRLAPDYSNGRIYMTWRVSYTDPERLAVYSSTTPGTWSSAGGSISDVGNEPSYAYPPAITGRYSTPADQPWLVWLKYDGTYSLYFDAAEYEDVVTDTLGGSYTCLPSSGVLPFNSQMTVTLDNLYTGQLRRFAARINFTLANGSYYPNWRAGYTNVAAGDSYVRAWNMNFPNYSAVVGSNLFVLVAEDVTPSPYNQPPYPPAGDTFVTSCTVTGIAP